MLDELFLSSVEESVSRSMNEGKILVVYNSLGEDVWLDSWCKANSLEELSRHAIWLKLVRGTEQFKYFEQIFPSVVVPSLYLIRNGQILVTIEGEDGQSNAKSHWEKLLGALGMEIRSATQRDHPKNAAINKSLKEQAAETAQRKYHEEMIKQRRQSKEERDRILKLVEADKAERRVLREGLAESKQEEQAQLHDNIKDFQKLHTKTCTLLIRLTNGENITKTFDSKLKLNDVRRWVDTVRTDNDCPYAFHRNIPRVTFSDSDELKTLEALDLPPRSALIVKPLNKSSHGRLNVAEAKGPGLLGKVFNGISSWWVGNDHQANGSKSSDREEHCAANSRDRATQRSADPVLDGVPTLASVPSTSTIHDEMTAASPNSSRIDSPVYSASEFHLRHNPSELSLPSRCVTPNVHQFVNVEDEDRDNFAYNGNNIKLEKKKDEDE